jgi:hypothetical protein
MKKPFKLISHDRHTKKGVVASSLDELTAKGISYFSFYNKSRTVQE